MYEDINTFCISCELPDSPLQISRVGKVENRGKHWADKVKAGKPPTASAATKEWAARHRDTEEAFHAFMHAKGLDSSLPWQVAGAARSSGNTQKVLYMELLMLHHAGAVRVELAPLAAEGLFGIVSIDVPPDGRPAFDAGSVPSIASVEGTARKSVAKIWKTAGFLEQRGRDGALVYKFDCAVSEKQRAQQSAKRRRTDGCE